MEVEEKKDWRAAIRNLLKGEMKSKDKKEPARIIIIVTHFLLIENDLYKRSYEGPYLRCISEEERKYVMKKIHEGCCDDHLKSRAMVGKAMRAGSFWTLMRKDAKELVIYCGKCQIHAPLIHISTKEIILMSSQCPFAQLGNGSGRPLPVGTGQREFLIMVVDYFSIRGSR